MEGERLCDYKPLAGIKTAKPILCPERMSSIYKQNDKCPSCPKARRFGDSRMGTVSTVDIVTNVPERT